MSEDIRLVSGDGQQFSLSLDELSASDVLACYFAAYGNVPRTDGKILEFPLVFVRGSELRFIVDWCKELLGKCCHEPDCYASYSRKNVVRRNIPCMNDVLVADKIKRWFDILQSMEHEQLIRLRDAADYCLVCNLYSLCNCVLEP